MPMDLPEDEKSPGRQTDAAKTPREPVKARSAIREARLGNALRENLRRRKAGGRPDEKTPEEKTKDD